jgi:2-iminobutanoate/2-iminopropanoate deaminase
MSAMSGLSNAKVGDRPLVYPQGPGDPPSTIENKAGVISKRDPREEPPVASRSGGPATGSSSSAANDRGVLSGVSRPAWAVAQQNAQNERVAQNTAQAPAGAAGIMSDGGAGGYTQVTRYGDMLFISGQIAFDPRSGAPGMDSTVEGQTRQVMEQLRSLLDANRMTMANVVSVTMFLTNINSLVPVDRVYSGFFKGALPSRSVVEVARLPRGALIEISAVAGR